MIARASGWIEHALEKAFVLLRFTKNELDQSWSCVLFENFVVDVLVSKRSVAEYKIAGGDERIREKRADGCQIDELGEIKDERQRGAEQAGGQCGHERCAILGQHVREAAVYETIGRE